MSRPRDPFDFTPWMRFEIRDDGTAHPVPYTQPGGLTLAQAGKITGETEDELREKWERRWPDAAFAMAVTLGPL